MVWLCGFGLTSLLSVFCSFGGGLIQINILCICLFVVASIFKRRTVLISLFIFILFLYGTVWLIKMSSLGIDDLSSTSTLFSTPFE